MVFPRDKNIRYLILENVHACINFAYFVIIIVIILLLILLLLSFAQQCILWFANDIQGLFAMFDNATTISLTTKNKRTFTSTNLILDILTQTKTEMGF